MELWAPPASPGLLGVSLGIQVSNWNEGRKERALEATYLARVAQMCEATPASLTRSFACRRCGWRC